MEETRVMVVCGNGGKFIHTEMHHRRGDGHHAVVFDVWRLMFPEERDYDERKANKSRVPAMSFAEAVEKRRTDDATRVAVRDEERLNAAFRKS
jgi:hypothetical protein